MIQPNDRFAGKVLGTCTLDRLIGRGGMSVVYHAQQTRPQRPVAVKILLPDVPSNSRIYDEFLARFLREADVIATLDHHNIIDIFECDLQDGLAYLVMPYLTGGNLAGLLKQRGKLSLQEALKYGTEAAEALDYAHSQGIIHRDLKPSNFLLHADGHLVLADFGIASIMQDRSHPDRATLTISGTVLGTPEYIAPEMALGKSADHRADLYELGIVLFQMLAGYTPFKGRTSYEIMMRQINEQLPLLHRIDALIPATVDAVLQQATAKNPDDRYNNAKEMMQALSLAVYETYHPTPQFPPTVLVLHAPTSQETIVPPVATNKTERLSRKTAARAAAPSRPTKKTRWELVPALLLFALAFGLITTGMVLASQSISAPKVGYPSSNLLTPTQEAKALVQAYYGDINRRDYPAAYELLGKAYQSDQDYQSFVTGYALTMHDDISFENIIQRNDGTILVLFIIKALEKTSSGTQTSTYQTSYIVGQEHGQWRILSGTMQKI